MRAVLGLYSDSRFNVFCPAWFTSNHDENSWNGTEEEKYGEMAIPLAVFSATWKGVPLIYSGQELPNQKRLKFFDHDPIDWNQTPSRHDFYKQLLGLRKKNDAFSLSAEASACLQVWNSVDHHVLTFFRKGQTGNAFIAINFSPWTLDYVEVDTTHFAGSYEEAFSGVIRHFNNENRVIKLQPWGYQVWLK
jgi:glycosidase